MSDNKQYRPKLMNTLVKLDFYKSKSIMIIESNTTQEFNTCTPLVKIKFARRADAKSGGSWDDNNSYWYNGYSAIFDFFSKCNNLMAGEVGGNYTFTNPAKGKGISIRKNEGDNKQVWYLFTFFVGSKDDNEKITASLTPSEMASIVGYFKSFMTNYPVIAMQTMQRHDYWWQNTGKNMGNKDGGGYQNNQKSGEGYNNNGGGNYNQQNNQPDQNMMNDIENEYGGDDGSGGSFDDVPF